MVNRLPVHGLDPAGGTDGQVPVIDGGKFVIGDQTGGSPLSVEDEGTEVEDATTSMDFLGTGVTATSDGSGHVTVTISGTAGRVPLTTVIDGVPDLVWDADNQLVTTEAP